MQKIRPYVFYIVLFIFILAMGFYYSLADWDLWARLIVGKTFFQTGSLLNYDFYSYTPTHRWLDHEWGSSLVFYFIQKHFGDIGFFVFKALVTFSIFFMCIKTLLVRGIKNTIPYNFLFFFFAFYAMAEVSLSTIRCQLFTFFFFTLWLYVLERVRQKGETRLLWILPSTMLVWSNMHGGCFAGLGLLVLYIAGEFLNKKPVKKYIITLFVSLLTLFINPYGIEFVTFLFSATTMKRPFITEWQSSFSPLYLTSYLKFKFFMGLAVLTSLIIYIKKILNNKTLKSILPKDYTKTIILLAMLVLAIKHVRHQPFFVISVCVFLYDDFYYLFNKTINKITALLKLDNPSFKKTFVFIKETLIYLGILFICILTLIQIPKKVSVYKESYPAQAVQFIKTNNLRGNIFTGFHYGSYVAYKLYPNNLILMDGRYEEVYYPDMLPLMKKFHLVQDSWDDILKLYPSDILLIDKKYDVYYHLTQKSDYLLIYEDKSYGVFVLKKDARPIYKTIEYDQSYYDNTKFQTDINWN